MEIYCMRETGRIPEWLVRSDWQILSEWMTPTSELNIKEELVHRELGK